MTTLRQKLLLVLGGILFSLLLIEVFLRVGGLIISYRRQDTDGETTVLCLGESTTEFGGVNSWPRQLERILNQDSLRNYTVINRGVPGTTTAFILSRLENDLDRYKPDIVITMMGINDCFVSPSIKYVPDLRTKIILALNDLRVVKLAKWVILGFQNKEKYEVNHTYGAQLANIFEKGDLLYAKENFTEVISLYENALKTYPDNPVLINRLILIYYKVGDYNKSQLYLNTALNRNESLDFVYYVFGLIEYAQGNYNKSLSMFKTSWENTPLDDNSLLWIIKSGEMLNISEEQIKSYFKDNGYGIEFEPKCSEVLHHNSFRTPQ